MESYIAGQVSKLMSKKRIYCGYTNILIMGPNFKENSPELRNTRVVDLVEQFESFNCNVYDLRVDKKNLNKNIISFPSVKLKR